MGQLRPPMRLARPRLLDALSAPVPFIAVIGPIGAGATTLLRQYAETQDEVTWVADGVIPDRVGSMLVIDDADGLSDEAWARVKRLRAAAPELVVRIALRSALSLPADADVEWVGELQYTPDETAAYIAARGSHLDSRAVHLVTGGHPAAVRVVVEGGSLKPDIVRRMLARTGAGALDAEDAAFAVPEHLTAELVADLGGPADLIERAERAGLGGWTVNTRSPLFVLTAPVRARTLDAHPIPEDVQRNLHLRSATTFLAHRAWFGALAAGAAAGSLDIVDTAIKRGGMAVLVAHGSAIAAILRGTPTLQLRRRPAIAIALAIIYNARRTHRIRAVELLSIALMGVQTSPRDSPDRTLLRVVESVARRLLGVGDGGVKAARAAVRTLDGMPPQRLAELGGLLGDLRSHSGMSLLYGGEDAEALAQFEQALAVAERPGVELTAIGGTAAIHAFSGDLPAARSWIEIALARPWSEDLIDGYAGSLVRIAEARLAIERGDVTDAEAALARVWHMVDTIEHWPLFAQMRAFADVADGRPADGLEHFRALRARRTGRVGPSRAVARRLDVVESSLALAAGDLVGARALTLRSGDGASARLGVARVAIFDGDDERALRILSAVEASGPEARMSHAVLEAIVDDRLGRDVEAAAAARRTGSIARSFGLRTPFLFIPADARRLFDGIASVPDGIEPMAAVPRLTAREGIVLRELVRSSSVADIAERLHVSPNTVKSQRRSLYRKLDARSRDEAIAIAMAHGLLETRAPTRAMNGIDANAATEARTNSST